MIKIRIYTCNIFCDKFVKLIFILNNQIKLIQIKNKPNKTKEIKINIRANLIFDKK